MGFIVVDKVSKKYERNDDFANEDISLTFNNKGLYAIIGASGSGKSTLLHIIGGLLKPTSGNVIIDDVDIFNLNNKDLSFFRMNKIGYVFQQYFLEDSYTAYENIELPLIINNVKNRKNIIEVALKKFNVDNIKDSLAIDLSGGEKQRVALARATINNPTILLCDEPTGNLDEKNGEIVIDYLKELANDILVIVVTHNLKIADVSDYVIKLADGKVVQNDHPII